METRSSKRPLDKPKVINLDDIPLEDEGRSEAKPKRKSQRKSEEAPYTMENKHLVIELEYEWNKMQKGITKLKHLLEGISNEPFTFQEYMILYTRIYNMCLQNLPKDCCQLLYERYKEVFEEYINSIVLPALKEKHEEYMLKEFEKRWVNHKLMVRWLSRFFNYLDRYFTPKWGLPNLREAGLVAFSNFLYSKMKGNVKDVVIGFINEEREGKQINWALLKNVLGIIVEIGMNNMNAYETHFEAFMLQNTASYYRRKSSSWIEEDSCSDYMVKVEECLKKEKERIDHYLHANSEQKLLETVQHELLTQHHTQLLEKEHSGCHALLRDDKVEDLSRMYRLFSIIPKGLELVAVSFKQHIINEGTTLAKQAEDATNNKFFEKRNTVGVLKHDFVRKIIELHDKYLQYVANCYINHSLFHRSLKEAFEVFCNKSIAGTSSAELLAIFCDNLLKTRGSNKLGDEEIEDGLDKVVKLLAYVSDKDLFAEYYKKKLAQRLMFNHNVNDNYECNILTKLKQQYGRQFTSKMDGMLIDMTLANENRTIYEEYLKNKQMLNPGIDMSVSVLTTGFWPNYKSFNLTLPLEMVIAVDVFKKYYHAKTRNRKLTWIYSLGTCNVKGNFDAKPIELIVLPVQAAMLLLFNGEDRLSYKNIKNQLNLTDEDIIRLLHSLSCTKYNILKKYPNTKTIGQSDIFEVNTKFTNKMRKIRIPLPLMDEKKKVIEDVDKDRRYVIDACVVRIMKSWKQLPYQQLVLECIKQCSQLFKPNIKVIKKRIEDLIARDYLERDKDNPNIFKYVA